MKQTLIVVRIGRTDPEALATAHAYAGIPGHDVVLCSPKPPPNPDSNILVLDHATLVTLGLYAHPDHARRCRDYALYAARAAHPHYAHYWLIDADLHINTPAPADFFARLSTSQSDLLAARLGIRGPNWGWGHKMQTSGKPVHGCALPIARLSAAASDTLLRARQRHATMPEYASVQAWPNDEAFVPTILSYANLTCQDLNETGAACYSDRSLGGPSVFDTALLSAAPADGLIYHPACDLEAWTARTEALVASARLRGCTLDNPAAIRTLDATLRLDRFGRACHHHPVLGDAALVPLMLAEHLMAIRPWQPPAAARPPWPRENTCRATLQQTFATPPPPYPGQATAHRAICTVSRHSLALVKATDFACAPGLPLRRFPRNAALPYAYDLEAGALLLTLHTALDSVLAEPFLYAAQREMTRAITRIPIATLPDIYGPVNHAVAPVLVFSIGRTGSTLFKKLIGCVTTRSFSEPDTLTQLAEAGPAMAALPDEQRRAMIYYAIAPLFHVRLPGGADGRCVIKLRSQANALCGEIARTFPVAKYVFMLRERTAWARSTFRSFGLPPASVARRLHQAVHAIHRLQQEATDLTVIFYDDVVADPHATVAQLTGTDPSTDAALHASVARVAASDSQAGHGLSRARSALARDGEVAWMGDFETAWAAMRPAALLSEMRLDY